jgi:hypothetical protein
MHIADNIRADADIAIICIHIFTPIWNYVQEIEFLSQKIIFWQKLIF